MRVRAWSTTCSVCTQTSPSGCHSGSCGQPTSACSSGNSCRDDAEIEREREADRRPRREAAAFRFRPRCARPADRRAGSSRHSARGRLVERRTRTARRTARRAARAGCRRRTSRGSTTRRTPPLEIAAAVERIEVLVGQRIPRDRVDGEVAPPRRLLDRHRRDRRSTTKPRWPRPAFDSRRGSDTSMSPIL